MECAKQEEATAKEIAIGESESPSVVSAKIKPAANASIAKRKIAWARLAADLDLKLLDELSFDLDFTALPQAAEDILAGKIRGRAVVKLP